jgi:hypothetical protein
MKLITQFRKKISINSPQERVIMFVDDKKNIGKATEGSMAKRIELFKRAEFNKRNT